MPQEELKAYNTDEKEIDKAKDYTTTLKLSSLDIGESILVKFLDDEPKVIEYEKEGKQEKFSVVKVLLLKRFQQDGVSFNINSEYDIPISSKTLSMGIAEVAKKYDYKLTDKVVKILVDETEYKKFGKNRCYRVREVEQ